MEQNLQVLPKKVWSLIRVVYMMLRKGVSKKKILLDLNMMMKRAKIAGKALQNLMFHHHHNWAAFVATGRPSPPADNHHLSFTTATATPPGAYEFSCSNSPTITTCAKVKPYHFSLFSSFHKKNYFHGGDNNNNYNNKEMVEGFSDVVLKAMELVRSQTPSPALPGFGRSPPVRQLRITDSPFPLSGVDEDEDGHVDEAAEEFISRFYNDLKLQNSKASFSSSC